MVEQSTRTPRLTWLAWLLIAAAAAPLCAQTAVTLEIDTAVAYVNEPILVTVHVKDFQECAPPTFPTIPDCIVRQRPGGSESSYLSTIGGRRTMSRSRTYEFELVPRQAGELIVPPVQVTVDGRTLETQPVRVSVRPSDAAQLFFAQITCGRGRIYIGQRVRLTLTIWVKPPVIAGHEISSPEMGTRLRATNPGPFLGRVVVDTRTLTHADGTAEAYYVYETWIDYVPDRPGPLVFDDVELSLSYPVRVTRDLFGQLHFSAYRNLRANPTVENIEILPLPTAGQPPNFTGAVGTYDISVAAQPTTVRVGDPIELTIEIRGDGPLDTLPAPDLAADPNLTRSFRVPQESLAGAIDGNRKRFTQTIRAVDADVYEIPAIEYPYFDPDRETYAVAFSDPIPLTVSPALELDAETLVELAGPPPEEPTSDLRVLDGLRGNQTRDAQLLRTIRPVSLQALAAVTCAPPAVFLLCWAASQYVRSGGAGRRRRQAALRTSRRRLDQARRFPPNEAAAQTAAALTGYLADRLDQPAARFLDRTALDALAERNIAPRTREAWRKLIDRCEQASFGGATQQDSAALIEDARACLRALEGERL